METSVSRSVIIEDLKYIVGEIFIIFLWLLSKFIYSFIYIIFLIFVININVHFYFLKELSLLIILYLWAEVKWQGKKNVISDTHHDIIK